MLRFKEHVTDELRNAVLGKSIGTRNSFKPDLDIESLNCTLEERLSEIPIQIAPDIPNRSRR